MKMNKKGFTIVELLASFVIISILVVGMLTVVFKYREKASLVTEQTELVNFHNNLTNDIMTDVTDKGVKSASSCGTKCVHFEFLDATTKDLVVPDINTYELYKTKYISYGGRRYEIVENIPSGASNPEEYQNIIFGNTLTFTITPVGTDTIYKLDFSIKHINLDKDYGLHLSFLRES